MFAPLRKAVKVLKDHLKTALLFAFAIAAIFAAAFFGMIPFTWAIGAGLALFGIGSVMTVSGMSKLGDTLDSSNVTKEVSRIVDQVSSDKKIQSATGKFLVEAVQDELINRATPYAVTAINTAVAVKAKAEKLAENIPGTGTLAAGATALTVGATALGAAVGLPVIGTAAVAGAALGTVGYGLNKVRGWLVGKDVPAATLRTVAAPIVNTAIDHAKTIASTVGTVAAPIVNTTIDHAKTIVSKSGNVVNTAIDHAKTIAAKSGNAAKIVVETVKTQSPGQITDKILVASRDASQKPAGNFLTKALSWVNPLSYGWFKKSDKVQTEAMKGLVAQIKANDQKIVQQEADKKEADRKALADKKAQELETESEKLQNELAKILQEQKDLLSTQGAGSSGASSGSAVTPGFSALVAGSAVDVGSSVGSAPSLVNSFTI